MSSIIAFYSLWETAAKALPTEEVCFNNWIGIAISFQWCPKNMIYPINRCSSCELLLRIPNDVSQTIQLQNGTKNYAIYSFIEECFVSRWSEKATTESFRRGYGSSNLRCIVVVASDSRKFCVYRGVEGKPAIFATIVFIFELERRRLRRLIIE